MVEPQGRLCSIEALENIANIKVAKRGHTGIEEVDLSERPVFGFGSSSKNQCASANLA